MGDERFNGDEQPVAHEDQARRLVLDIETDRSLQANLPDGRQAVIEPPIGTVGGPRPSAAEDATTMTKSVPSGGGPGDSRRMDDVGDEPTQTMGRSEDTGEGASPNRR